MSIDVFLDQNRLFELHPLESEVAVAVYQCDLTENELLELNALLEEFIKLSIFFAERSEYGSVDEAEAVATALNELIQRGDETRSLLLIGAPIPESLLLGLVDGLQLLVDMADALRDLGYRGTFRLKRRAEYMISVLGEACLEI